MHWSYQIKNRKEHKIYIIKFIDSLKYESITSKYVTDIYLLHPSELPS